MNPIRRRRLGGNPFSPLQVPGLWLWLKADSLGLADNTAVATWADSSGKGNNATQATAGLRPTYKDNILNGKPGVLFASASLTGVSTPSISVSTFTIISVFKMTTAAGLIYEQSVNSASNPGQYLFTSTGASLNVRRGTSESAYDLSANWGADNVARSATHTYDGTHAGHTLSLNGVLQSLTTSGGFSANPGTGAVSDAFYIGERQNGSAGCNGYLFELLVVTPTIPLGLQRQLEQYVRAKYTLP